jgi:hypothetical protein
MLCKKRPLSFLSSRNSGGLDAEAHEKSMHVLEAAIAKRNLYINVDGVSGYRLRTGLLK